MQIKKFKQINFNSIIEMYVVKKNYMHKIIITLPLKRGFNTLTLAH